MAEFPQPCNQDTTPRPFCGRASRHIETSCTSQRPGVCEIPQFNLRHEPVSLRSVPPATLSNHPHDNSKSKLRTIVARLFSPIRVSKWNSREVSIGKTWVEVNGFEFRKQQCCSSGNDIVIVNWSN